MKMIRIDIHLTGETTRKVLRVDRSNGKPSAKSRAPQGARTREEAYRTPILKALYEAGGSGECSKILERVGIFMGPQLNDVDRQILQSGEHRWRNAARFQRNQLREAGLLTKTSSNGVWELSTAGIKAAEVEIE